MIGFVLTTCMTLASGVVGTAIAVASGAAATVVNTVFSIVSLIP